MICRRRRYCFDAWTYLYRHLAWCNTFSFVQKRTAIVFQSCKVRTDHFWVLLGPGSTPTVLVASNVKPTGKSVNTHLKLRASREIYAEWLAIAPSYKCSVGFTWSNQFKCKTRCDSCRFFKKRCLLRLLYLWLVKPLALLQHRWTHAPFVAGVHTNKRSVGLGG